MVRIAGQDPHLPARGQEFLHHGPAHEAGAAGHQGFAGLCVTAPHPTCKIDKAM